MRASMQMTRWVLVLALLAVGCDDEPSGADASTPLDAAMVDAAMFDDGGTPRDGGLDAVVPSDGGGGELELTFGDPPVSGLPEGVRFAQAVPYGPVPRQVMDAFLPESDAPTAAVLFFHGGGFVGGSRESAYDDGASALRRILDAGIAWIGVDYQLLDAAGDEMEGVQKSVYDARRALQFVRHHAAAFNVDPGRIGLHGSSAGAGTSLWLAFHPDMAEPESADPIARQSTRPQAAAVLGTQATYDVLRWAPDVFSPDYPLTNEQLLSVPTLATMVVQFYGLPAGLASDPSALMAALETAEMQGYREELDLLELLSADDPPAYVHNAAADLPPNDPAFDLLHHPLHARTLYERAQDVGAELFADVPAFGLEAPRSAMAFLIAALE